MRVTTPLTLVVAVELPLDVDEDVLLRLPLDEPPLKPADGVGFGEGVRVLDGVGFGVGAGVAVADGDGAGVTVALAEGVGTGEPLSLVASATKVATGVPVFVRELVVVDDVVPVLVDALPVAAPLLAELPPSAMVVVSWAAASVKSAWIVSAMVPVDAVAVR